MWLIECEIDSDLDPECETLLDEPLRLPERLLDSLDSEEPIEPLKETL
jgi:hypothetical protein